METKFIVMSPTIDYINYFIVNGFKMTEEMESLLDDIRQHTEQKKTKEGIIYLIINQ